MSRYVWLLLFLAGLILWAAVEAVTLDVPG